jgi:hypothetical protein
MGRPLAVTHNGIVTAARAAGFYTTKTHNRHRGAEVESSQSPAVQNAEAQAPAVAYGMQPIAGGVHDR